MNGSIRKQVRRVETIRLVYTYDDKPAIDRKEHGILVAQGEQEFVRVHGRRPECDNDWWLEWGDDEIAFCFAAVTTASADGDKA